MALILAFSCINESCVCFSPQAFYRRAEGGPPVNCRVLAEDENLAECSSCFEFSPGASPVSGG